MCPSPLNPVPKREREEDSPEAKKARLEELPDRGRGRIHRKARAKARARAKEREREDRPHGVLPAGGPTQRITTIVGGEAPEGRTCISTISRHGSETEPADAAPRICIGQPPPGYKHVLVCQAGARRLDSDSVFSVGKMEPDSGGESAPHRLVAQDRADESLPHRALQPLGPYCQERGDHASSQGHGMVDRNWGVADSQMGFRVGEASGHTGCTHQDDGTIDPRSQRASQDHQCREPLQIPVNLRASQRPSDLLGEVGDRSIVQESRRASMGYSAGMDRVSCSVHHGMPTSEGAGRPLISGPDASLVTAGPLDCTPTRTLTHPHDADALQVAFPIKIHDVPAGVQAVMQCLLWPFWCDAQRRHLTLRMHHQLWVQSTQKPCAVVHLSRKLQWATVVRKLQNLTSPALDTILKLFLTSHKSDAHSGERGTHPSTLDEVGARAQLPEACMCLQINMPPAYTTLQECVDAWGAMPSRLCLLRPADSIFLALKHHRRGSDAGNPRFSLILTDIALPVAAQNTSDSFLVHYQVRSIVACEAAASAAGTYRPDNASLQKGRFCPHI